MIIVQFNPDGTRTYTTPLSTWTVTVDPLGRARPAPTEAHHYPPPLRLRLQLPRAPGGSPMTED